MFRSFRGALTLRSAVPRAPPTTWGAQARRRLAEGATPPRKTPPPRAGATGKSGFDLVAKAESHGIALTRAERELLLADADALGNGDGRIAEAEWDRLVCARAQRLDERVLLCE